ncbi:MAG: transposase family protein [Zoogloeaceae bacterium]|nr:transposase family protein [Zoogloeaceae bacterium]
MRADPIYVSRVAALAEKLASLPHGGKGEAIRQAAQQLSVSIGTLKRDLGEIAGRRNKVRADKGKCDIWPEELALISSAMMGTYRANDKRLMSLKAAVEMLRSEKKILAGITDRKTGEILPASESTIHRALKRACLHPGQLRKPAPVVELASLYPNHVWELDASISTLFYAPDSGDLKDMPPEEFYKNKPDNFTRIRKQRLTRYAVTDHFSGEIFVWYVVGGESIENLAEAMIRCMVWRSDRGMHGVPLILLCDPGSAAKSGAFGNLCRRLSIRVISHKAGNARVTGQVEKAHDLIEKEFESGFKFQDVPGIDWINAKAMRFLDWFNSRKKHTRHKATRHTKWLEIKQEQLRLIDRETAIAMLTHRPESRAVDEKLEVRFEGKRFSAAKVPGVYVGIKLMVARNPYSPDTLYVVDTAEDGSEKLTEIPEVETSSGGYSLTANVIGEDWQPAPKTVVCENRARIKQLMTGETTEAAADAALKKSRPIFGGRIDPYAKFNDLPDVTILPKRGVDLAPTATTQSAPIKPLTHFEAARWLAAQGVVMDVDKNARIRDWWPDGVPEGELATLKDRFTTLSQLTLIRRQA